MSIKNSVSIVAAFAIGLAGVGIGFLWGRDSRPASPAVATDTPSNGDSYAVRVEPFADAVQLAIASTNIDPAEFKKVLAACTFQRDKFGRTASKPDLERESYKQLIKAMQAINAYELWGKLVDDASSVETHKQFLDERHAHFLEARAAMDEACRLMKDGK